MGKKKHSKDKLYLSRSEWNHEWGGYKAQRFVQKQHRSFDRCAMTMVPFTDPVCTRDGMIFEITNIVPYVRENGTNPVTGEPLLLKDLIKLNFFENSSGNYHCPLTFKVFTKDSHIVAIRPSGNVFSYEAVKQLNIKEKMMNDLVSGEAFSKKDIVTIQDPTNVELIDIAQRSNLKKAGKQTESTSETDPNQEFTGVRLPKTRSNSTIGVSLEGTEKTQRSEPVAIAGSKVFGNQKMHYTTGKMSSSFTSTALPIETQSELADVPQEDIWAKKYAAMKDSGKQAFVQMHTNYGDLNLQLFCDGAPMTCHYFIQLASKGVIKEVKIHQSTPGAIVSFGVPRCGQKLLTSEFNTSLRHRSRGILSMAEVTGDEDQFSRFFLTYKSAPQFDDRHTVFGRLVGGFKVLDEIEAVPVNSRSEPKEPIVITNVVVLSNPFEDGDAASSETEANKRKREYKDDTPYLQMAPIADSGASSVGKYIAPSAFSSTSAATLQRKKPRSGNISYGDFSAW